MTNYIERGKNWGDRFMNEYDETFGADGYMYNYLQSFRDKPKVIPVPKAKKLLHATIKPVGFGLYDKLQKFEEHDLKTQKQNEHIYNMSYGDKMRDHYFGKTELVLPLYGHGMQHKKPVKHVAHKQTLKHPVKRTFKSAPSAEKMPEISQEDYEELINLIYSIQDDLKEPTLEKQTIDNLKHLERLFKKNWFKMNNTDLRRVLHYNGNLYTDFLNIDANLLDEKDLRRLLELEHIFNHLKDFIKDVIMRTFNKTYYEKEQATQLYSYGRGKRGGSATSIKYYNDLEVPSYTMAENEEELNESVAPYLKNPYGFPIDRMFDISTANANWLPVQKYGEPPEESLSSFKERIFSKLT